MNEMPITNWIITDSNNTFHTRWRSAVDAFRADGGVLLRFSESWNDEFGFHQRDVTQEVASLAELVTKNERGPDWPDHTPADRQATLDLSGAQLIMNERNRQISAEGYTLEHDDAHDNHALMHAAGAYLDATLFPKMFAKFPPPCWPWEREDWKITDDPVRNLTKAGALIAAEIDRIKRKGARDDLH